MKVEFFFSILLLDIFWGSFFAETSSSDFDGALYVDTALSRQMMKMKKRGWGECRKKCAGKDTCWNT